MSATRDDLEGALIGLVCVLPSVAAAVAACATYAWQWKIWLETVVWPAVSVHDGLNKIARRPIQVADLMTSYLGLNELIRGALDQPLPVSLIVGAVVWAVVGGLLLGILFKVIDPRRR